MNKTRIEALADGIFAIAMTLLVFGISATGIPEGLAPGLLPAKLLEMWPKVVTCAYSFVVLGIYWIGHHNQFHYIRRVNRVLLWINILFLLCVSIVPLSSSLFGKYMREQLAVDIYAGHLIVIGLINYAHWSYATGHQRLVDPDIDPRVVALAKKRILTAPLIFLSCILISFFSPALSVLVIMLVPIIYILPGGIDRYGTKETIANSSPETAHEQSHEPSDVGV